VGDAIRKRIEVVATIVAVLTGLSGLIGAWFVIPYRVEAVEKRQIAIEMVSKADHDILVRMEERLISVQKTLEVKK
jgi:hypothetical protein